MILNISGRCDICAFYSKWLENRIDEGYYDVRNPFNKSLVSRIYEEDIDLYVFCTKNPIPVLPILDKIKKPIYFMVTLTGYHKDIEVNVPDKKCILESIKELSKRLGKENVVLRYDPILLNDIYTVEYHLKALDNLMQQLDSYIDEIIFSFMDDYKNVRKNYVKMKCHEIKEDEYIKLAEGFKKLEEKYHIRLKSCLEDDVLKFGFRRGECLSKELVYRLTKKTFKKWKERDCGCQEIVDIGAYNSCNHRCMYCYANFNEDEIIKNMGEHDPKSSLLIGHILNTDIIKRRRK